MVFPSPRRPRHLAAVSRIRGGAVVAGAVALLLVASSIGLTAALSTGAQAGAHKISPTVNCDSPTAVDTRRAAAELRAPGLATKDGFTAPGSRKKAPGCTDASVCPPAGTYELGTTAVSWQNARDATPTDMTLLIVDSAEENACVLALTQALPEEVRQGGYWMGATDATTDGSWTWLNGTSFWLDGASVIGVYQNWYPGEPSGDGYCGEFWDDGSWNDEPCTSTRVAIYEPVAAP
jgi:hypothetical protein